jgi:hypothetical protein
MNASQCLQQIEKQKQKFIDDACDFITNHMIQNVTQEFQIIRWGSLLYECRNLKIVTDNRLEKVLSKLSIHGFVIDIGLDIRDYIDNDNDDEDIYYFHGFKTHTSTIKLQWTINHILFEDTMIDSKLYTILVKNENSMFLKHNTNDFEYEINYITIRIYLSSHYNEDFVYHQIGQSLHHFIHNGNIFKHSKFI